jgi:hypothetical protein
MEELDESEYFHLFIVTFAGTGSAKVLHLTY